MSFRLMEIALPADHLDGLLAALEDQPVVEHWHQPLGEGRALVRLLVAAEAVEGISDRVSGRLGEVEGFRMVLSPVEATLPKVEAAEPEGSVEEEGPAGEAEPAPPDRISRDELYEDLEDGARVSRVFLATVVLSTLVAAIGLLRGDVAVIIGAMVIAPLLRPNMALALAVTLGDLRLAGRAARTNGTGLAVALAVAIALGLAVKVDPSLAEISSRTRVGLGDIGLALAAGSAGVLAFTSGVPAALIGVMVAVALLPPAVVLGLLLGSGHAAEALGAALLLGVNLTAVNLAGVVTFLLQGVAPRTWWESEVAHKATRVALVLWLVVLAVLAGLVLLVSRE